MDATQKYEEKRVKKPRGEFLRERVAIKNRVSSANSESLVTKFGEENCEVAKERDRGKRVETGKR